MNKTIVYIIGVVIIAGGIGFFGGNAYGKGQTSFDPQNIRVGQMQFRQGLQGQNGQQNNRGMNGIIAGDIVSKDDTSITVKLRAGGSRIIYTTASTTVLKSVNGTRDDLSIGSSITAEGKANNNGSITAQSIQLRSTLSQTQDR